ncbi:MAG TPA: RagB/SusD family nutrient uptake outer membrane protein [Bacteroidales bacterium]|nr:RagB/SusD family nutrient uptake outer membrane protein [Bacteroidales bacterium]
MKNLYKKLICPSIVILSLISCTDNLNLSPISQISNASFWTSDNDANGALYGMYVQMRAEASERLFLWGEARSEIWTQNFGMDPSVALQVFLNSLSKSNPGPDWTGMYTTMHSANLILKYVPGISFASESQKKSILAQAHAMRAFLYFTMAKTWGDIVLVTEPTEGYDPNTIFKERSSQTEVFTLIKKDIDDALSLFPDNNFPSGRNIWSKPAVNAMKGDVYLWTAKRLNGGNADLTIALNALNEVETSDVVLLPKFSDIFSYSNKGNKEIIMAVKFLMNESPTHTIYGGVTGINAPSAPSTDQAVIDKILPFSGKSTYWQISDLVANQFIDDDSRKAGTVLIVFRTVGEETTRMYNLDQKFPGIISANVRQAYDDFVIYRYADILLLRAEVKNALGQDPSADINKVRQRAYGDNYINHIFVNATKDENDEIILQERLFELTHEGKRWWDLVRFGKAFEKVPTLQSQAGKDYLLLFPIGESILSLEPKIVQNPGY